MRIIHKGIIAEPIHEEQTIMILNEEGDIIVNAPVTSTKNIFFLAKNIYQENIVHAEGDVDFKTTESFYLSGRVKGRRVCVESDENALIGDARGKRLTCAEIKATVPKVD